MRNLPFLSARFSPAKRRWIPWVAAGALLRLLLIVFPRPFDDDAGIYLELGHNLLHRGTYGLVHGSTLTPSLFRLPGYPLFLAGMEQIFSPLQHGNWWSAAVAVQAVADLAGGVLLAAFARRHLSASAGEVVLALAMLCPFTAAYAGIAMTESLSIFAVSLGLYATGRALDAAKTGRRENWAVILAGLAAGLAMLLRPDGVLLFAVLAAGLFAYTDRPSAPTSAAPNQAQRPLRSGFISATLFCLVALTPLAPWTWRNWSTFHLFQPLAPRHCNDPGERVNLGVNRWISTWLVEYTSTANVFWNVGTESIDIDDRLRAPSSRPGSASRRACCWTITTVAMQYRPASRSKSMRALPHWPPSASAPIPCAATLRFLCCAWRICFFARARKPFPRRPFP